MDVKNSKEIPGLHSSDFVSDHSIIEWLCNINGPNMAKTRSYLRNLKKINCDKFAKDLDLALRKTHMMDNHYMNSMMVLYQLLKQLWTSMHKRKNVLEW